MKTTQINTTIDAEFEAIAKEINQQLVRAAKALTKANELAVKAKIPSLIITAYLADDLDEETFEALDEKLALIDASSLECEMQKAGWSTSSSYC
jgi:hypothetical protein